MCTKRYWYFYTGSGSDTNPINYIRLNLDPSTACNGGPTSCAIYACPNAINPTIPAATELTGSGILANYLIFAKLTASFYPFFPQKPYVYTKTP